MSDYKVSVYNQLDEMARERGYTGLQVLKFVRDLLSDKEDIELARNVDMQDRLNLCEEIRRLKKLCNEDGRAGMKHLEMLTEAQATIGRLTKENSTLHQLLMDNELSLNAYEGNIEILAGRLEAAQLKIVKLEEEQDRLTDKILDAILLLYS